jgi:type IV pilus assembly protein PilC
VAIDLTQLKQSKQLKMAAKRPWNKEIHLFGSQLSDKKKEYFFSQVSLLLSSGIDLRTAFEIFIDDLQSKSDLELFKSIHNRIISGANFFEALKDSKKFSDYDCYSLKVAEETGQLYKVMEGLKNYYSKNIKLKRQFISALIYPSVVILTAILAVSFMLKVIVPMFANIYKRSNIELPELTKIIIRSSNMVSKSLIFVVLFLLLIVTIHMLYKDHNKYRDITSRIVLKIPLFGKIIKMIFLERFFQSMCLLSESKVPLLSSIQIIKNMIRFYPLQTAIINIEAGILEGLALHECMMKYKFFDKRSISFIKVGEETNNLDKAFSKIQDQYSNEIDHQLGLLQTLLEPILIIFIGAFVGVILVSMYLPMFKMGSAF